MSTRHLVLLSSEAVVLSLLALAEAVMHTQHGVWASPVVQRRLRCHCEPRDLCRMRRTRERRGASTVHKVVDNRDLLLLRQAL